MTPVPLAPGPIATGEILNRALPYIQAFRNRTFVVKYGGSAMSRPESVEGVLRNVLLLQLVGIRIVLVHGGGPEIDRWLEKLSMERRVLDGLRVTDDASMDVVEMALAGRANKALVAEVERLGGSAVGLSGRDAGMIRADPYSAEHGRTGRVTAVHPELLVTLTENGYLPIVCSVAQGPSHEAMNVNADTVAASIASAIRAEKLLLLSDTAGVLADTDDPQSRISVLGAEEARTLIATGGATGGMVPKLDAALAALDGGVRAVHLIDGAMPNALLVELFTGEGTGTMLGKSGSA